MSLNISSPDTMMLFIAVFLRDQETLDKLVVFPPLGLGKTLPFSR